MCLLYGCYMVASWACKVTAITTQRNTEEASLDTMSVLPLNHHFRILQLESVWIGSPPMIKHVL